MIINSADVDDDDDDGKLKRLGRERAGNSEHAYDDFLNNELEYGYTFTFSDEALSLLLYIKNLASLHLMHFYKTNNFQFGKIMRRKDVDMDAASKCLIETSKSPIPKCLAVVHLLKLGADANYADPATGDTALHWFSRRGSLVGVKLMVSNGADVNILNNRLRNPLMEACDTKRL